MCLICDLKNGGAPQSVIDKAEALGEVNFVLFNLLEQFEEVLSAKDKQVLKDCYAISTKAIGHDATLSFGSGTVLVNGHVLKGVYSNGEEMSKEQLEIITKHLNAVGYNLILPTDEIKLDAVAKGSIIAPSDKTKH